MDGIQVWQLVSIKGRKTCTAYKCLAILTELECGVWTVADYRIEGIHMPVHYGISFVEFLVGY